jgi:hypothetical protein
MSLRLYRNAAGEHVPAWRLTPAEAVAVRDALEARDLPYLSDDALRSVQATSGLVFSVAREQAFGKLVMGGWVAPRKAA